MRLELEQQGFGHVKVTTVAPSYIDTGMFEGARGPLLTPVLTPEYVVDKVWKAMLSGRPLLMLPWSVGFARLLKGVRSPTSSACTTRWICSRGVGPRRTPARSRQRSSALPTTASGPARRSLSRRA